MTSSGTLRKKLLSASVASVLGLSASGPLQANTYEFSFTGAFTMLNPTGGVLKNQNSPYSNDLPPYVCGDPVWCGNRTPISGTITYDSSTGAGTLTINGFYFFGAPPQTDAIAQAHDIMFVSIGNGTCLNNTYPPSNCGTGNLLLGNMLFDWNLGVYPVSTVWDATGMITALPGLSDSNLGTVISGTGALPASNGIKSNAYPLGPTPVAVTTPNTTNNPNCTVDPAVDSGRLQCAPGEPSGITPLIADTIGGSPIVGTSFAGYSPNFDLTRLTLECYTPTGGARVCANTPVAVFTRSPAPGATSVDVGVSLSFSFTKQVKANTVVFDLTDAGGNPIGGTLSPNSSNATNFTFTPSTPLNYTSTYTATITDATDINDLSLTGAPVVWSFTTGEKPVGPPVCTVSSMVPLGSNFTMLNKSGATLTEATNDIVYSFEINGVPINIDDPANLNMSESDRIFNMKLASAASFPFFGFPWTAHTIRVFGPGTYTFDTTCTPADIAAGTSVCNRPFTTGQTQQFLTMTVGPGQLGAHMLFDWNTASNIDVVNVWNRNQAWNRNPLNKPNPPALGVNDVFTGDKWGGPSGVTVNPYTTYQFVSTPANASSQFNGAPMVDGAFIGFFANFNLGPSDSCLPAPKTPISVEAPTSASGCTISSNPTAVSLLGKSEWLLIGGFLAWLGAVRRRFKRQTQS